MRRYASLIIGLLLLASLPLPGWGATYYVTQSGAGAKTGADIGNASALSTFNAATAPYDDLAGDTVYFCDSITATITVPVSGLEGSPVVLRGDYAGHAATVNTGGSGRGIYINGKNYINVYNITVQNAQYNCVRVSAGHDIIISGVIASTGTDNEIGITGASYNITVTGCTVTGNAGIYMSGGSFYNITVSNNTAYNITGSGICVNVTSGSNPHDIIISGNTSYGCSTKGIFINGYSTTYNASAVTIDNNTTRNNGCGIYIRYSTASSITNNHTYSNTVAGDEGYGIGVEAANTITIRYNVVYGNLTDGIELWASTGAATVANCIVSKNLIYDHTGTGRYGIQITTGNSASALVSYNVLYGNTIGVGIGIATAATSGVLVCNNSVFGGTDGLEIKTAATTGYTVRNNIFSGQSGLAMKDTGGSANITHTNNLYYKSGNIATYAGTTYTSVDIATLEATCKNADPLFISSTDLRLRAGSPAINAGDNTVWAGTANVTDYAGRAITDAAGNIVAPGGTVDIGAYEWKPKPLNIVPLLMNIQTQ